MFLLRPSDRLLLTISYEWGPITETNGGLEKGDTKKLSKRHTTNFIDMTVALKGKIQQS
jgi:hypothetical protein